jgi:hypothetical protein
VERDLWQLVGFVLIGIAPWLGGYIIQRSGGLWSVTIRPPRWVVWLCGNPRRDGQIDLGSGGMQLTGLIPLISGPLSILLGVEFRLRGAIVISVYLAATIVWLILVGWVNRRQRVGPSFEVKRAQHYAKKALLEDVEEVAWWRRGRSKVGPKVKTTKWAK